MKPSNHQTILRLLTKQEFDRRAASAARVAVFREFLADRETPVAALSRLEDNEEAFLLESVSGGEMRARHSYLGIEPTGRIEGADALREIKARFAAANYAPAPELPSFQGGAVGYIAYDAVQLFEPKVMDGGKGKREEGTPPMAFLVCDKFLIFDNALGTVTIVVVADATKADAYESAMAEIDRIYDRILSAESIARVMERTARAVAPRSVAATSGGPRSVAVTSGGPRSGAVTSGGPRSVAAADGTEPVPPAADFQSEMSKDDFCEIVAKCKDAIAAGEVIQIVPSQKFTATTAASDLSLYRALRMINPSPYNFFMRIGGKTLIGSSPEELVKLEGRTASTAPIAGTRPRGATPAIDAELERELKADEKENAEHVMLVDLGRNDLGRVCETGSVKVEDYAHIERYSHVMHLVSNVKGTLAKDRDAFDLVKAAFPAGTLSGAPKVRAMQILAELEKSPRGIYGGAAGYFSLTGDMDLAIVIRTLVKEGARVTMRSGAGIVADSNPEKEYEETLNKAKAVFEAVKFAEGLA